MATQTQQRIAVVLFNLGGPDGPGAVQPFLFNLFNDPAIIGAPGPIRWALAKFISARRAPIAREIYAELGGGSPLVPNTEAQAEALGGLLSDLGEVRIFISMRYWHPMSDQTAAEVAAYQPDQVILLPLYPQFSTTTVASSLKDWRRAAAKAGLTAPSKAVCCYPDEPGFVQAIAGLVTDALDAVDGSAQPRVLFSAHGLPKKIVAKGDPYQWQVEQSAAAVAAALGDRDLDWVVCYQSRVGPLEWIGPSTDDEILRAGRDGRAVVLVPIAFVSEHSETLVELDIEYRKLAEENRVPAYHRVPTVGVTNSFVAGLAGLVRETLEGNGALRSCKGGRLCPQDWSGCPWGLQRS